MNEFEIEGVGNLQEAMTQKPEETKQQSNYNKSNYSNNNYSKNNSWGNKSNNKKSGDLYSDTNISPVAIDLSKFVKSNKKTFAVTDNGAVPEAKLQLLLNTCKALFNLGYIYRSQASNRSATDKAIRGLPNAKYEIYKLWAKASHDGGEDADVGSEGTNKAAYQAAAFYHKRFLEQKDIVRCIYARDTQLVFGENLNDPVDFILAYTECGSNSFGKTFDIKTARNAWYMFKLAGAGNISIFNVNNKNFVDDFKAYMSSVGKDGQNLPISKPDPTPTVAGTPAVQEAAQPEVKSEPNEPKTEPKAEPKKDVDVEDLYNEMPF